MRTRAVAAAVVMAVVMAALVVAAARGQQAAPGAADDKPFLDQATELTAKQATRLDKLMALHGFVRDGIAQAKTEFG